MLDINGEIRTEKDKIMWNATGIHEYTVSDIRFREWMLLLINFLGGMAGRGTEMLSQLYKNKMNGRRNLFVSAANGQAYSVTEYHKSEPITDSLKPIARCYPWVLTRLLLTYFSIVVPFHEWACPEYPRNGFIFPNGNGSHWKTNVQTELLERETLLHLGTKFNSQKFRHFQAEFDRRIVRSGQSYDDYHNDSDDDDDAHDTQAGHSSQLANRWYGQRGERMDLPTFIKYSRISKAHHRALGYQSGPDRGLFGPIYGPKADDANNDIDDEVEMNLKRIYPDGTWKSDIQKEATMKIIAGSTPRLLCILPTGGGKSLLMILPTMIMAKKGKSSIMLTPYRALADQMIDQCQEIGLPCLRWTPGTLEKASMIIVVTDTGTLDEFHDYMNDLFLRDLLAFTFMDECHAIGTESHFRYKFERFKYMNITVPWIFLTGTMPPSKEGKFALLNNIVDPPLVTLRVSTNRSNAWYIVERVPAGKIIEAGLKIINKEAKERREKKIIVFVNTIDELESWRERLICSSFAAGRTSNEEELREFENGTMQMMVATSALGVGLNFKNIGAVFVIGVTFGAEEFVQMTGRGGREGTMFKAVIIIDERMFKRLEDQRPEMLSSSRRVLREFIITRGCRRKPLTAYMDGTNLEADCNCSNSIHCDNCREGNQKHGTEYEGNSIEKRRKILYEGPRMREIHELTQKEQLDLRRLRSLMESLKGRCLFCWVEGINNGNHGMVDCTEMKERNEILGMTLLNVVYEENSCCYRCGLPGDLCDDFKNKRPDDCVYDNIGLVVLTIGIWNRDERVIKSLEDISERRWIEKEDGFMGGLKYKREKELCKWLGGKRRVLNENGNNLFGVWWNLWQNGYDI
jgi:superfamily II DNA helicase RecQ